MPHVKIPFINWLDAAWEISAVLEGMPTGPINRLAALLWKDGDKAKGLPLSEDTADSIEILLIDISLRLAYRLQVRHKAHKKLNQRAIDLDNRDPRITLKAFKKIESAGVALESVDYAAFDAHIKLSRILIDGYVSPEWKRTLPLLVASIGGATTSQTATLKATQPRSRQTNELREGKCSAAARNPYATWKELLLDLEGDDIVENWNEDEIEWNDGNGNLKTTKTKTFRNWKTA